MYSFAGRIRYSETGRDRRLTIPMLLNYFQDSSTMQSEEAGIGFDYLVPMGLAWVLNFWQVDINRLPLLGEEVIISTFPYAVKGALGWRNYSMQTKEGETLAVANALYTLLNLEKRLPCRPDAKILAGYALDEKLDMEYCPRKFTLEGDMRRTGAITVSSHHIDANDHVNNAQYVAMACDLLPEGFAPDRILATYHNSAVRGDEIFPCVYEDKDRFGVDLRKEDESSFCKVQFLRHTRG